MSEEKSTHGPGNEANRKRAERQDLADERIVLGKKEFRKDQRCRRAIKEEVVPLDRRSDRARNHRLNQRPALGT